MSWNHQKYVTRNDTCNSKVKDLMNQQGKGQNEDLIRELFSDDEVHTILRIPLSSMGITDKLLSNSIQNSQYSVASGYKVARNSQKKESGDEGISKQRVEDSGGARNLSQGGGIYITGRRGNFFQRFLEMKWLEARRRGVGTLGRKCEKGSEPRT